jgi:hypothetical protein
MKVRSVDVGRVWDCMLCTCVTEPSETTPSPSQLTDTEVGWDGEGVVSEGTSLLSYTLRYVSLTEVGTVCQFGL